MKYLLLVLAALCSISSFAQGDSQEITDEASRFFWNSNTVDIEIVKQLLTLVNKALDCKVQSAYFQDALEEITKVVEAIDMKTDEKVALLNKIATLIRILSQRSHHELKSIMHMRKELEKES